MKKIILTFMGLGLLSANAQTKHLPKTITITLTDQQVLRIDSAVTGVQSLIDSKKATNWFLSAFQPFYDQAKAQMVTDSVKKVEPKNK